MDKKEVRIELQKKLDEKASIVAGKSRITPGEAKAYHALGKVILELRGELY